MNNYAVAKLAQPPVETEDDEEPDDDLIAALREGLAQADRGELLTMEEVDARIRAKLAARNAPMSRAEAKEIRSGQF